MTVTVTVAVGDNHEGEVRAQVDKFTPEHDTGAGLVLGAWAPDGDEVVIEAGTQRGFGVGPNLAVKVWEYADPEV